jgi:hypothetical protein
VLVGNFSNGFLRGFAEVKRIGGEPRLVNFANGIDPAKYNRSSTLI